MTESVTPEVRRDFVQDGLVQAKQDFDRERPVPRLIDPIPVEGRNGEEAQYPGRPQQAYQAVHLLGDTELGQMSRTESQSLDAQARALTTLGSDLIPELVQVCALMYLAKAKPTREQVDRLVGGLDLMVQQVAQLRNGLATHR